LRRHYALLSDEALVAVDRSELVDVAKQVYDQELSQRRLKPARSAAESAPVSVGEADVSEFDFDRGVKPSGSMKPSVRLFSRVSKEGTPLPMPITRGTF